MTAKKPRGWIDCPIRRHARAVKAAEASRLARLKQAYERAGHMHPIEAYASGYKTGYMRAYHYWKVRSAKGARGAA